CQEGAHRRRARMAALQDLSTASSGTKKGQAHCPSQRPVNLITRSAWGDGRVGGATLGRPSGSERSGEGRGGASEGEVERAGAEPGPVGAAPTLPSPHARVVIKKPKSP